jgi:hypothetical protein
MRARVILCAAAAACGGSKPDSSSGSAGSAAPIVAPSSPAGPLDCTPLPFAESSPVPEASGAAWLVIDGKLALVVISDSGNDGAYAIVDPDDGKTREEGKLPLDGRDDDLEGVATRDGKLYGVTSPGWMRVWKRVEHGFELVDGPYPLGPVDLPDKRSKLGADPPEGDGMVCSQRASNCGRNYEGLCISPDGKSAFVAAKADGHLYALVEKDGKYVADHGKAIAIARPGVIADCAFSDDGSLFVGSNLFDAGRIYRVTGWQDPATAKVAAVADLAIGFPETLAVRGDVFYRMSDTGGAPSLMAKYRCHAR